MKSIIVILGLVTAVFTLKVNAQHEHHQMNDNSMDHTDMIMKHDVDEAFQEQLAEVVKSNQKLNNAFVSGDVEKVENEAENVKNSLSSVDMKLLKGEAHMSWMKRLQTLNEQLSGIISANSIDEQRKAFVAYNEALFEGIKAFGVEDQTVFYQHCPMANGGNGANWVSLEKEIQNPYYGKMMLTCGSTVETIQGQ